MRKLAPFLSLIVVAGLALCQGYKLARAPKLGQEFKYRMSAEFDLVGTPATMTALLTEKVVALDINGNYTVESRQYEGRARLGGHEQVINNVPPETAVYSPRGEVIEIKSPNGSGLKGRLSRLNSIVVPDREIKIGDSWSHTFLGNPMTGGIGGKANYKAEALEKVSEKNAVVVALNYKESSGPQKAESSGKAWIDSETGELLKLEAQWKNVPYMAADQPVDLKVTLTRV